MIGAGRQRRDPAQAPGARRDIGGDFVRERNDRLHVGRDRKRFGGVIGRVNHEARKRLAKPRGIDLRLLFEDKDLRVHATRSAGR